MFHDKQKLEKVTSGMGKPSHGNCGFIRGGNNHITHILEGQQQNQC